MPRYSSRVRSYSPSTSGVTSELGIVWSSSGGHNHDGVESSLIDGESYSLFDFRPANRVSTIERSNIQERNREALKSFIVNTIKEDYIEFNNILLGPDVIGAQNIVAGSINSDLIAANTIVANNIAANTITTELLATDAVQSLNYDAPDGAEIYSDAGSFLDLSNGEFITPGLRLYSNGDLYISNSVVIGGTTANTIVDGAAAGANSIPAGGAAADVNNGSTTIGGTKITANSITTSQIATDAIKSGNYDGPDAGEVFSDAGSFLDLSGGNFISTGFSAYSNGSVYISSSATIGSTTASTVVSGAAAGANAIPTGGAANDVNTANVTVSGTKITSNSITTTQLATDSIKSTNYDAPDSGEVFSDAGTFLDLSDGNFISTGFAAYSNGSVYISSSATIGSTTASTVVSGAASGANSVQVGGAASDVNSGTTNISGGKVRTGDIQSTGFVRGSGTYSTTGARFDLDSGDIIAPKFRLYSNGVIYATDVNLTGTINASGGTFSGNITANGTITGGTLSGASVTGSTFSTSGSNNITLSGSQMTLDNGGGDAAEIRFEPLDQSYKGTIRSTAKFRAVSELGGSIDLGVTPGGGVEINSGTNIASVRIISGFGDLAVQQAYSTISGFVNPKYFEVRIGELYSESGIYTPDGNMHIVAGGGGGLVKIRGGGADPTSKYVGINGNADLTCENFQAFGPSKSFRIYHPIVEGMDLVHACIEGPKIDLLYRGTVQLVDGSATVNIDTDSRMTEGTFVALVKDVQCYTTNESDWDAVKGSVNGNILTITCKNSSSNAIVSWMVIATRNDNVVLNGTTTDSDGNLLVEVPTSTRNN